VSDNTLVEIRDLLAEIRDLLKPVADAYQAEYQQRQAIRALLSTEKRKKAWLLADGSRTQRELAKAAGMDEGGASKFFKSLRELGAISDSPNPKRTIEVG
jgi:DNA-binding MarR family transcriptional regulator